MARRAGTLRPVGAVIVHYESPDDLARCLRSLDDDAHPPERVMVVDNSESDEARAAARSVVASAGADLLDPGANLGFAAGCNRGAAELKGCRSLLFLNQDAELGSGGLDRLVAGLAADPARGAVNPLVLTPDRRVWFAGGSLDPWLARLRFPAIGRPATTIDRDRPLGTEWLNGCALLVRSAAWTDVGGFDERFFLYWEDVEWSRRLTRAGWGLGIDPTVEVVHHRPMGDGLRALTPAAIEHAIRSRLVFVRHHLDRVRRPTAGLYTMVNAVRLLALAVVHRGRPVGPHLRAVARGLRRGVTE